MVKSDLPSLVDLSCSSASCSQGVSSYDRFCAVPCRSGDKELDFGALAGTLDFAFFIFKTILFKVLL